MIKLVLLLSTLLIAVHSHNNGVARTPPMGWNSWNQFGCSISQDLIKETIDGIVSSGLAAVGYNYVNIDDCWSLKEHRNATTGEMIPDPVRFSAGIKALADYAHSKGVKLGIYSDVGFKTCQGYPGSFGYYQIDANTFASWEIDYLKLDFCYTNKTITDRPWDFYADMSTALNKTGRPIVYSVCNWGYKKPWEWAPQIANSWRTTGDIGARWTSVLGILDANRELYKYSQVGSWNDSDMLEIGVVRNNNEQLTPQEARSHFSLWTMLNSPLLLGNDLRKISQPEYKWVMNIIANKDAISVNQDKGAKQARLTTEVKKGTINSGGGCDSASCIRTETWTRPLSGGSANFAALMFNRAGVNAGDVKFNKERITLTWSELGVSNNTKLKIKDIWNQREVGIFTTQYQSDEVGQHDVAYLLLTVV